LFFVKPARPNNSPGSRKKVVAMKKTVHVVPRDGDWAVRRGGAERDSSHHDTQADAIDAARRTAQRENSELFIHRRNGQIRERDSLGHDPYPPKG
jgi:hypothetical protein